MGPIDTLKSVVGVSDRNDGREKETGQSSTLPPAGQLQSDEPPRFQGPGGPEAPQNGGEAKYERVGMRPAGQPAGPPFTEG
ncbi:hypothetical protein Rhopal_004321-T1 [Rhodotorula paludigena]|uniref:Uncharacterized protein n=1 Tax=Rhodotorula paludigena TaxID=86838 RepID=A0AAV5GPK5_9BASI|nr:hypothetical protein Rhopal_004321-T1 [Rhodotorula paludigena]